MKLEEKRQLLALFDDETKWCQGSEARDGCGRPVGYDDGTAVAWDLVGAMCHLFGWCRASQLFIQVYRSISGQARSGRGDEEVGAMAALFDFNDALDTNYDQVVSVLQRMPVWHGRSPVA